MNKTRVRRAWVWGACLLAFTVPLLLPLDTFASNLSPHGVGPDLNNYLSNPNASNTPASTSNNTVQSTTNGLGTTLKSASPDSTDTTESKRCDVPFVGWVFCQASRLMGVFIELSFKTLQLLLETEPLDRNSSGGQRLYEIWSSLRTIANVVFVIMFLVIIVSHTTNIGITNYGIKRLLPRIIVSVILLNVSFWIGLLVMDIANVVGESAFSSLKAIADTIHVPPELRGVGNVVSLALIGTAAGALIYVFALSLFPMLLHAFVTLCLVVIFLVARQAVMIALIVVSPIAFALNVLPGTQKWFSKWWSAFITSAMVYPIIGVIYGMSLIAANILRVSPISTLPGGEVIAAILGLAALVLPFAMVPKFMKMGGSLMNQIGSAINKPDSALLGAPRRAAQSWSERRGKLRQANALRDGAAATPFRALAKYNARVANTNRRLDRELKPGTKQTGSTAYDAFVAQQEGAIIDKGLAGISDPALRQERQEVLERAAAKRRIDLDVTSIDAQETLLTYQGADTNTLRDIAFDPSRGLDDNRRLAAIRMLASQGNISEVHDLLTMIQTNGPPSGKVSGAIADGIEQSRLGSEAAHLSGNRLDSIRNGTAFTNADVVGGLISNTAVNGHYSPEGLSKQSNATLQTIAAYKSQLSPAAATAVTDSARKVITNSSLHTNLSRRGMRSIHSLA